MALSAARRAAAVGFFDDRAQHRRLRPDAAFVDSSARRRRVGYQRPQVVHVERHGRGLPDHDGRDEPDAGPYERASMIIVPSDAPGLKRLRNIPTMAGESERFGYGHAEILYENVRVPAANLLGKRGQGFLIAQARLGPGRIHHCMRWLGLARRAFDMLCERALQREAFGKKLASHETVQNWIADSAAEMSAARLMTLHAAWVIDTQGAAAARKEISLIKFFGAKVLHDVIDRAIQVHGSLGYSAAMLLEELYRTARGARTYA